MFWFRVELDEQGKVLSCQQVAKRATDGGGVFFVCAGNGKSASEQAYREYHRLRQVARRERYAKEGRCKCGRARDKESPEDRAFATCPACRALYRPQHQRSIAKQKGEQPPEPPVSKADHFVQRRNEEKRLLLEDVKDKFLRMTMTQFGKWLNAEIEKLQEKPAPKLRVVGR